MRHARDKFNGRLNIEWIPVTERMPLDEYDDNTRRMMVAHVLVLVVDTEDWNDDPAVVDIMYECRDKNEKWKGWLWQPGDPYPEVHAKNIRYWCYHPAYLTRDILEYERLKPLTDFCDGKKPLDIKSKK